MRGLSQADTRATWNSACARLHSTVLPGLSSSMNVARSSTWCAEMTAASHWTPPCSIERRSASHSIITRSSVIAMRSAREASTTRNPWLGTSTARLLSARRPSASRTTDWLASYLAASAASRSGVPGRSSPRRTSERMASWI